MVKVGFIGLGRIGKPIAVNIIDAGYDLAVLDLREETVKELARLGAKVTRSPREVAEHGELVELAVVDDVQVEQVLLGDRGVFEGARPGTIVAIHSTVLPETVRKVAEVGERRGIHIIDAPVSGGEAGAREKALCYMVGGDESLLERCRAVFATSASLIVHLGALGSGAAAKLIVQLVVCINMLAAHEAELLSDKSGLNLAAMQQVLRASSAQSFVTDHWLQRFKRPEEPLSIRRQRTDVFQKSLAPAIELARNYGLSLSGAELAARLLPQIMGVERT